MLDLDLIFGDSDPPRTDARRHMQPQGANLPAVGIGDGLHGADGDADPGAVHALENGLEPGQLYTSDGPQDAGAGGGLDVQPQDSGADAAGAPAGGPHDLQPQDVDGDAAGWRDVTDAAGWRGIVRADVADLEAIDMPTPCRKCGGIVAWFDLAGDPHCERCQPPRRGERLRRLADTLRGEYPRTREARRLPAIEWPAALADFALLLTPDDLPAAPFALNGWTTVLDRARFLAALQVDVRFGQLGPRARSGALQADLRALADLLLLAGSSPTT